MGELLEGAGAAPYEREGAAGAGAGLDAGTEYVVVGAADEYPVDGALAELEDAGDAAS